ncbi:MAG TPA: FAD-binding protein, partial [Armatimonadota bacterium]|nr:FAD-binding protein [Armatimonadota bacterium]
MQKSTLTIGKRTLPVISTNTVIVGTGAASLNAAVQLDRNGVQDLVIVTEKIGGGTSNNTGSDKQTYYKLSLSGDGTDSTYEMAASLFDGGSMHGDIALIEATLSAQSFYNLVSLGVPFPHNRYGGYVGYKTDHDPRQRATSAGPKTSMLMFEALYREVQRRNLPIINDCEVIAILTNDDGSGRHCKGLLCLDKTKAHDENQGLFLINATNVVFGTGGPAVIYKDSVYPEVHTGSSGIAYEAGVSGQNLTEWQYGLASTKFRWNVSGTYMQVIPRFISTDQDGNDEREFLNPFFDTMEKLTTDIFLKGYQWPFDPRKVQGYGSSIIDILVYNETVIKGRRVFLDFRRNPSNAGNDKLAPFSFEKLEAESFNYLKSSNALLETPIERLQKMNPLAIDLYKEHDIDITVEPLEIAVCAQHNNGGLKGNIWWESDVRHFFPVGEVNGSHGVYRPGGSALNSGQCGSLRAAQFIAKRYQNAPADLQSFVKSVAQQVEQRCAQIDALLGHGGSKEQLTAYRVTLQERMTAYGAHIRDAAKISQALQEARKQLAA